MTLIIYDIRNDKRRRKAVKLLESIGIRVQYSAFECLISAAETKHISEALRKLLHAEDSLRIYSFNDNITITDIGSMPSASEIDMSGYIMI